MPLRILKNMIKLPLNTAILTVLFSNKTMKILIEKYRVWGFALRNGTLDQNDAKDSERVVRTFGETHAISAKPNPTKTGYEGERSGLNHWTRITQRTACSRAAILGSGRRFCLFEFNYRMWAKRTSAFADVLFCILCSWVRKSRDSSLSRFVRATFQVAYGKVRTVIVSKRFFSHPYFCANMVTNLILIRLPFSSVLWSWPKSSLYLCNVQPA